MNNHSSSRRKYNFSITTMEYYGARFFFFFVEKKKFSICIILSRASYVYDMIWKKRKDFSEKKGKKEGHKIHCRLCAYKKRSKKFKQTLIRKLNIFMISSSYFLHTFFLLFLIIIIYYELKIYDDKKENFNNELLVRNNLEEWNLTKR